MKSRKLRGLAQAAVAASAALLFLGSSAYSRAPEARPALSALSTPVTAMATRMDMMAGAIGSLTAPDSSTTEPRGSGSEESAERALGVLASAVRQLSHPRALHDAFASYFAFRDAHPERVRKPYLYFVDYGLPSTTPRGYVFDMASLKVVDGPFTVAHGRGSTANAEGVPTRFSNTPGAATTSLGLYVAQELYAFRGKSGGQAYRSIGLRLAGMSGKFNDNARMRGVVAHGAPYVTDSRAGRSEGCPAMEQDRAEELLPKLANGGLVFLFAPDSGWMANDPWVRG